MGEHIGQALDRRDMPQITKSHYQWDQPSGGTDSEDMVIDSQDMVIDSRLWSDSP